jgi:hypothetical protein
MVDEQIRNGRVRGRAWVGVTPGAHRLGTAEDPWRADLAAWQSVLPPAAVFTGLTAARTRGWWLPPLPEDLPVFVAVGPGGGHPERTGLVLSRHPVSPACEVLGGLRLATPAEALLSCARVLGLLHVACGVAVEPQRVVVDEYGNFVARGDLWLIGTTTLHEYDGAHHLTRVGQRRDLARGRRVAGVEWVRRGYTSV